MSIGEIIKNFVFPWTKQKYVPLENQTGATNEKHKDAERTEGKISPRNLVKSSDDPLENILSIISPAVATASLFSGVSLSYKNVCMVSHLIFNYLKKGTDAEKLSKVIKEFDKTEVASKLHQFPWNCQSLPEMVGALVRCATLYEEKNKLQNCRDGVLENICTGAVGLLDDMLLPLSKHKIHIIGERERIRTIESEEKRRQELLKFDSECSEQNEAYERVSKVTEQVLEASTKILKDSGEMWPEKLGDQLKLFCANVPRILLESELKGETVKESLAEFANQIPDAIKTFSKCKAGEWKETLGTLYGPRPPNNSRLCEIWQLLVLTSRKEGFEFLGNLLEKTINAMLRKRAIANKGILREDYVNIAEDVTGTMYHLFLQCIQVSTDDRGCYEYPEDENLWQSFVCVEISKILGRNGEKLKHECWGMYDYLNNKMVSAIKGINYKVRTESDNLGETVDSADKGQPVTTAGKTDCDSKLGKRKRNMSDEKEQPKNVSIKIGNIDKFSGVIGPIDGQNVQIGDHASIYNQLKQAGVPQNERDELRSIVDQIETSTVDNRETLVQKGLDWLKRNGSLIGGLAQVIRGWFDP